MKQFITIIIPNYNGEQTIGKCLESVFAFPDDDREVIVVDDCSDDRSPAIIKKYPCRLIQLDKHAGASAARNAGAYRSSGNVLFFIDADCLLKEDTLSIIRKNISNHSPGTVIGGTYTPVPHDPGFFSLFQSVFINYFETKNFTDPDYVATHAMVIHTEVFRKIGGFVELFLPILEDVEFSHRLRTAGYTLLVDPELQVRHIFNYTLWKSLRNAARKTHYWIVYSLAHKDLFADSGTASRALKVSGFVWLASVLTAMLSGLSGRREVLMLLPPLWGGNLYLNWDLFRAFQKARDMLFAFRAGMYYTVLYPAAIWVGVCRGLMQYHVQSRLSCGKGRGHLSSGPEGK
jgi:GT2 family glycosyltransferase